jgi:hypothetical protein
MKKSIVFCILKVSEDSTDPHPDPDPLVRGTDPRIRIRANMSLIWNTAEILYVCSKKTRIFDLTISSF